LGGFYLEKVLYICKKGNDMYVIIKHVKTKDKRILPVIMLDTQGEVWEFDNEDKAQEMVNIFNTNTDSGHKYEVKKV
jgi:hypothetical protein